MAPSIQQKPPPPPPPPRPAATARPDAASSLRARESGGAAACATGPTSGPVEAARQRMMDTFEPTAPARSLACGGESSFTPAFSLPGGIMDKSDPGISRGELPSQGLMGVMRAGAAGGIAETRGLGSGADLSVQPAPWLDFPGGANIPTQPGFLLDLSSSGGGSFQPGPAPDLAAGSEPSFQPPLQQGPDNARSDNWRDRGPGQGHHHRWDFGRWSSGGGGAAGGVADRWGN